MFAESRRPADGQGPTLAPAAQATTGQFATALYITGPRGGVRHLVQAGALIRLGRGADSTIVVDDPRVSRLHVALHVGDPLEISDLGSANGTLVGRDRLASRQARGLSYGETFFIGDSALVLRPSGLAPPPTERTVTLDRLAERLSDQVSAAGRKQVSTGGIVVLKVRAARPAEVPWVEAIVGELLATPADWVMRLGGSELAVGLAAPAAADALLFERRALRSLASWSIAATIDSTFLPPTDAAPSLVLEFLRGSQVVTSRRGRIIVRDPAMQRLMRTVTRAAAVPISTLLLGETGVGKDVIASMLHELSPRKDKPFVVLNCASLPEALLETELFGHERGAFTGAVKTKVGLLESADGGTVFLDEIGELALPLQAKVLRAIESCEVTRVGGVAPRRIDVRFVAATNRDLDAEVEAGRFRRDLFHRLNGVTFTVPPLRERRSEIEPLARQFLEGACARFQLPSAGFSPSCLAALAAHTWPGNVRELRNVVERAALLAGEVVLEPHHLGLPVAEVGPEPRAQLTATTLSPNAEAAGPTIEEALALCGGNQTRAAKLLRIPRRTLVRRIGRLGLPRPRTD
jgi:two-component system, NtrC family, response regulator AtoC